MAPYTLNSNNIFLSCIDVGVLDVYEITHLDIVPVKEVKQLGSFQFGRGKEYDSLKIGFKDIKALDLRRVMDDLFYSRLMVNRDGLCFLPTEGITSELFEIEYYRMFDLFNWSKYGVTMNLKNRWIRSDIVEGSPLGEEDEYEDEYEDDNDENGDEERCNKRKELNEVKRMHNEELDIVKHMHEKALQEVKLKMKELEEKLEEEKHRHDQELKEVERVKDEDIKKKQDEIDELNRKHEEQLANLELQLTSKDEESKEKMQQLVDLEKELKLRVFERSGSRDAQDFFARLIYRVKIPFPTHQITERRTTRRFPWETTQIAGIYTVLDFKLTEESVSSLAITLCTARPIDKSFLYDQDGWYAVKVSNALLGCSRGQPSTEALTGTLVFYGGWGQPVRIVRSSASLPQDMWQVLVPFDSDSPCEFPNGKVYYLQGHGVVVGYFFGDPEWRV